MKMFGRMMSCCVVLLLTVTSVSAVRRALNSITDLRSVDFGQSVPEQSLWLLHWFANEIGIEDNNIILLTFDPNSDDYGSHRYYNKEELLDPLPRGYQYYSLGNIHQHGSLRLPSHVNQSEDEDGNRARIIIRIWKQNVGRRTSQIIDEVYITQHYETSEYRGTEYDPQHTYQITPYLLRAIRRFSLDRNDITLLMSLRDHFGSSADDSQLWEIRNTWGDLACLGLLLFIVIPEKYSTHKRNNRRQPAPRSNAQSDAVVNIPESRRNDVVVSPQSLNSNLFSTSQNNSSVVCCFICAVVIVGFLIGIGILIWALSPKH